ANEQEPKTIADGARTLSLGVHNWEILKGGIEDIVEVPDEAIEEAVRVLYLFANLKVEPTGALAVAAVMAAPQLFSGKKICCIASGGNADAAVYARIITGGAAERPISE
ncbi:MAG TPA: pyridoxal-phosphate dependent enzyme, partial [Candidatus Obscuribacterales bacterium]